MREAPSSSFRDRLRLHSAAAVLWSVISMPGACSWMASVPSTAPVLFLRRRSRLSSQFANVLSSELMMMKIAAMTTSLRRRWPCRDASRSCLAISSPKPSSTPPSAVSLTMTTTG